MRVDNVSFENRYWTVIGGMIFSLWQAAPSHHDDPMVVAVVSFVIIILAFVVQKIIELAARALKT